jgi:hypothetical protein
MTDAFSGSISGDLVGSTLTFSGGSSILGDENPLPPFDPAGAGVDVFGVSIAAIGATGAYRNFTFDVIGGSVTHGVAPGGIPVFSMLSGSLDYFAPPLNPPNGTLAYTGQVVTNTASAPVSITQAGLTETLSLPVTLLVDRTPDSGPVETWTGTLVATRTIPEPGTALLASLVSALWLGRRRRPGAAPK